MSASLVGSEMCIRDSSKYTCGGRCEAPMRGRADASRTKGREETDAPRPVSYTHLTLPTICSV
eukprot:10577394-Alexandrium_andersonii.AAC.1